MKNKKRFIKKVEYETFDEKEWSLLLIGMYSVAFSVAIYSLFKEYYLLFTFVLFFPFVVWILLILIFGFCNREIYYEEE